MQRTNYVVYTTTFWCSTPDCYEEHVGRTSATSAEVQERDYTSSLRAAGWAVLVRDGDIREALCPDHVDVALTAFLAGCPS